MTSVVDKLFTGEEELKSKTVKALRELASKLEVKRYRNLKKSELISKILEKQEERIRSAADLYEEETDNNVSMLTQEESSFSNFIKRYSYTPDDNIYQLNELINFLYPKLLYIASQHNNYKISMDIEATFSSQNLKVDEQNFIIYSRRYARYEQNKKQRILSDLYENIDNKDTEGSGWKITFINKVFLNVTKIVHLKGSSYVELPKWIKNKKAIVNIQNKDQYCFLYSVLANLYPANDHKNLPSKYKEYFNKIDYSMLEFPVKIDSSIEKFEEANNLSINIYTLENNLIVPIRISSNVDKHYTDIYSEIQKFNVTNDATIREKLNHINDIISHHTKFINLFLYEKHYTLITSLSALLSNQLSTFRGKHYICHRCLSHCQSPVKFFHHLRFCIGNKASQALITLPKPNTPEATLKFTNFKAKIQVPFSVYYDFECMFQPISSTDKEILNNHTNAIRHQPIAAGYAVVSRLPNVKTINKVVYGTNAPYQFVDSLIKTLVTSENSVYKTYFKNNYRFKVPKPPYPESEAKTCHICESSFNPNDTKVIDHCHFTGNFRGYAHKDCNLNFKTPDFIPIFAHNSSRYDSHLFIKELCNYPGVTVKFLPSNEETTISFSAFIDCYQYMDKNTNETKTKTVELRFLDSYRFIASSLDKLTKNLKEHKYLSTLPFDTTLLTRKGIYPYEYMNSLEKFSEDRLPSIDSFYSNLRNETVSQDDYDYAQKVWKELNIQNLLQYTLIYLQTDVLHLADIFETFRDTCLTNYNLDPCHFYTSPNLSWNAMLYSTRVKLDLLTEQDKLEFFESQVRGGISTVFHRHAEANNQYLSNFDESKPKSFIAYLDANNLYGWAMSQKLPTGNFKWLNEDQLELKYKQLTIDPSSYNLDSNTGIVYEVDIEYPLALHDIHSDYPFLAEKMKVEKTAKLIPNLYNKSFYILNERNLVQAIQHGLKLTRIHRAISYDQSNWLQAYINKNTELRKKSTNDFEKDFFKLMNNSVFGKTMENIRNRCNLEILNDNHTEYTLKRLSNFAAKPNYKEPKTIFNSNIKIFHFTKTKIFYNKPIYIGAQILDISKTLMYHFHYSYMKSKFPIQRTLASDTDSIIYQIFTDDFYKEISTDCEKWFDTSCYERPISTIPLNLNKKVPGVFKNETGNNVISHFAANRAKSYCFVTDNNIQAAKKVLKGITAASRKEISFQDYVDCVMKKKEKSVNMTSFENREHNIYTVTREKVALDACDDKRVILEDGIHTLAYGHWRLSSFKNTSKQ